MEPCKKEEEKPRIKREKKHVSFDPILVYIDDNGSSQQPAGSSMLPTKKGEENSPEDCKFAIFKERNKKEKKRKDNSIY